MFEDVFIIDADQPNSYLVYAPEHKVLFAVNEAGAKAFLALKSNPSDTSNPMYSILVRKGLSIAPPPI